MTESSAKKWSQTRLPGTQRFMQQQRPATPFERAADRKIGTAKLISFTPRCNSYRAAWREFAFIEAAADAQIYR
jgi:hypothetical protein